MMKNVLRHCVHKRQVLANPVTYNKPKKSKNHTSTFVYCLLFAKIKFYFYLEKNWSSQNRSSQTVSAGPVPMYQCSYSVKYFNE